MKVIIIEDEVLSARRLSKMLAEISPDIEVVAMLESVHEALAWFEANESPEMVFLDIQLNDGTGFEIISRLDDFPHIIFTTAYEQYALDAFKYNSIDYLLKPIDKQELEAALKKLDQIHKQEESLYREKLQALRKSFMPEFRERFLVKVGNQFKSIPTKNVAYFYYDDGLCYLRTITGENLPIDHTLDHLMEELDPRHFFRVNRQYIVAMNSVKEIHSYFNSRLLLALAPATQEDVVVSRERVVNFKVWAGL